MPALAAAGDRAIALNQRGCGKTSNPGGDVHHTMQKLLGDVAGPINSYRNWTHNRSTNANVDQTVRLPTFFIGTVDDVIIAPWQI